MAGPDPGCDLLDALNLQPGDHRLCSLRGEAVTLPGHADYPCDLGRATTFAEDRLEHSDGHLVDQVTYDPVELCRRTDGAVLGELCEGLPEFFDGSGLAASECVEPLVGEHRRQFLGVVGGDWHKDKPSSLDAVIKGESTCHARLLVPRPLWAYRAGSGRSCSVRSSGLTLARTQRGPAVVPIREGAGQ
jgi:hypothetical protein